MDLLNQFLAVLMMIAVVIYFMILGDWRITTPFGAVGFTLFMNYAFKVIWNKIFGVAPLFDLDWGDFVVPFAVLLGTLALAASIAISIGKEGRKMPVFSAGPVPASSSPSSLTPRAVLMVLFLVVPPLLMLLGKWRLGLWPWESPVTFRGFIQSGGNMYLYIIGLFAIQAGLLVGGRAIIMLKRLPPWWVWVGFPGAMLYILNTGFSSTIITAWIPLGYFIMIRKRWRLEVFIPLLIPVAAYYAMVHLVYKDANVGNEHVSMIEASRRLNDMGEKDYSFLNRLDYPEQYVQGFDFALSLPGHDHGLNMSSVFIQWFPRALWPSKPLNFSSLMTMYIEPYNFYQGISANFGGLNEFLMAFGVLGLLVFGGLLVFLFRWGLKYQEKVFRSDRCALTYCFCYIPYLTGGLTAGYINDLALPYLLISLVMMRVCFAPDRLASAENRKISHVINHNSNTRKIAVSH